MGRIKNDFWGVQEHIRKSIYNSALECLGLLEFASDIGILSFAITQNQMEVNRLGSQGSGVRSQALLLANKVTALQEIQEKVTFEFRVLPDPRLLAPDPSKAILKKMEGNPTLQTQNRSHAKLRRNPH